MDNMSKYKSTEFIPGILLLVYFFGNIFYAIIMGVIFEDFFVELLSRCAISGIFTLALVPMIKSGVGLNFGATIGMMAGLVGVSLVQYFNILGFLGELTTLMLGIVIAILFGAIYGKLLNRLRGREDISSIFISYVFIQIVNIFWSLTGFSLETTTKGYEGIIFQLLFFAILILVIFLINKSVFGTSMNMVNSDYEMAMLSGIKADKIRIHCVIISMVIASIAMVLYSQSNNLERMYEKSPVIAMSAVAAVIVGGATPRRIEIGNVILGVFLYELTFLVSDCVNGVFFVPEFSEKVKMVFTTGIILFAFIRYYGGIQDAS